MTTTDRRRMTALSALALTMLTPMLATPARAQVVPGLPAPAPSATATRLDLVATGEVVRVPDIATLSAGVVTQARTAAAALSDNAARMAAIVAALHRAGIADRDVQTASIALSPQYRYADNLPPAITGYQASNQVSVRFRDIGRAGAILDTLVAQGANQIGGPTLSIDRPAAALDEARSAAIAIARARATLYARAAGLSVARILTIAEDGEQAASPRPMMMAMMRAKESADTPVAAGEQTLSVTVRVSFELR